MKDGKWVQCLTKRTPLFPQQLEVEDESNHLILSTCNFNQIMTITFAFSTKPLPLFFHFQLPNLFFFFFSFPPPHLLPLPYIPLSIPFIYTFTLLLLFVFYTTRNCMATSIIYPLYKIIYINSSNPNNEILILKKKVVIARLLYTQVG